MPKLVSRGPPTGGRVQESQPQLPRPRPREPYLAGGDLEAQAGEGGVRASRLHALALQAQRL
eukprot:6083858-Pyramimonas_sp.AAC.1